MRVIKEYKPCEMCEGTGLETNGRIYGEEGYQSWECRICDGHGKNLVTVRKEYKEDEPKQYKE